MSTHDLDWYELDDDMGDAGLPGTGITAGEKTTINNRLANLEAVAVPAVISDLGDVSTTGAANGDLLRFNGTKWVKHTPSPITVTTGMSFVLDGGGEALTTSTRIRGVVVPFAATITGWIISADASGDIVITVRRATYGAVPSYTPISGAGGEKPTLSGAQKNQLLTLTDWTTSIGVNHMLQIEIDSVSTVSQVTLNLLMTRQVGP